MGWLKKELWKRRKLCFFIDEDGEIVQEWFAADHQQDPWRVEDLHKY
jgi:hypothetical protein